MTGKGFEKLKMAAIFWLARRLPTCKELAPWMSEALETPLPLRRRVILKLHFLICVWCRRYNRQLAALRTISQRLAAPEADDTGLAAVSLSPEARERLKRALTRKDGE